MYLPILRGKQFELIALREIVDIVSQNRQIFSPVIEPVRESFSSLNKTLEKFKNNNINFSIIVNPRVGELVEEEELIFDSIKDTLDGYNNFQFGIYAYNYDSLSDIRDFIDDEIDIEFNGYTLIHTAPINNLDIFEAFEEDTLYHIVNFSKTSRRYHRNFPREKRVSLDDYFNMLARNADYRHVPDEPFSEEHLYYADDGFVGFSDYLTIGEAYSETGFLPYAVVIHITYADNENKIRIKHFVSDSNDDSSDVAGKFSEALAKLIEWVNSGECLISQGIQEFQRLYQNGHFPGLGVIKKLSIMHHLELVISLIS